MTDYEKVIEFFSEHEIAIYGFGPTDDGAEEGTLLWCIKELDDIYNRSKGIVLADRGIALKNQILNVLCTLIDIYEKEDRQKEGDHTKEGRRQHPGQPSDERNRDVDQKKASEGKQQDRPQADISANIAPVPYFRVIVPQAQTVEESIQDPAGRVFQHTADQRTH